MPRDYDGERFRQLALYVAERSANDPAFGKTKLAKILFYSDFWAFGREGESITGATYSKFPYGPFPRVLGNELRAIEDLGSGVVAKVDYFGKPQERLIPLKPVDIRGFTPQEISIVEQVIEALKDHDADGVARLSHLEAAWQFVADGDVIPPELIFVSAEPDDDADRLGQDVARRLSELATA